MAKQRLLIHGSSWTVGAYKKSSTPNSDTLVKGGLAELLSDDYDVTNISVQDNMNLGIWIGLREHLKHDSRYDKIIICQNDPLMDFGIWRNDDDGWLSQFPYSKKDLVDGNIDSISKMICYFLTMFYGKVSETVGDIPTYIIGGPSRLNIGLMNKYGLKSVGADWMQTLVPSYNPSYLESGTELDYATQWLIANFPQNEGKLKFEFIEFVEELNYKLEMYRGNPDLFAYHHPTAKGNALYYNIVKDGLK